MARSSANRRGAHRCATGSLYPVIELGGQPVFRVHAKHDVEPGRYAEVLAEMRRRLKDGRELARPVIRVAKWKGEYFAVEGSHRLKAAHELGLFPVFLVFQPWSTVSRPDDAWWNGVVLRLPAFSWAVEWKMTGRFVPNAPSTPK